MSPASPPVARDFMNTEIHCLTPEMSLSEAVAFLLKHKISSAPVIDAGADRRLVGFISEADCLDHLSNEMFFGSPVMAHTVRTIMKRHPVCVEPGTDVFSLASVFVAHNHRHLPVIDGGRLLGIVSRREILKALDEYYRERTEHRDLEQFPPDLHEVMNMRFVARSI